MTMNGNVIQANYEQLEAIAGRFGQMAEENETLRANVMRGVEALRNGGWEGEGANAFLAEMDGTMFPAVDRLTNALAEAQKVTREIVRVIREAEEEAARPFQGDGAEGVGGNKGGGDGKQGEGDTAVNDKPSKDLTVRDPNSLFTEEYMENMIGSHIPGENNPALNTTMEDALKQMQETGQIDEATLNKLADLRGVDRAQFRQQYEKFANLWRNSAEKGDISPELHGDFMGSTVSLRYGKVVGDLFGMDPVFGSILNPTGGLVGPGSNAYWPDENDAIGYHGTVHDAAGYLFNNHGLGPGYNYLGREPFVDTGNPLSGQVSGIAWWASHPQLNIDIPGGALPDIVDAPDFLKPVLPLLGEAGEEAINLVRPATYVLEGGGNIVDGVGDLFQGDFAQGANDILDGATTLGGGAVRTGAEHLFGREAVNSVVDLSSQLFGYP